MEAGKHQQRIEDYKRLMGERSASIVDQLAYQGPAEDDFEPAQVRAPYRPADLS